MAHGTLELSIPIIALVILQVAQLPNDEPAIDYFDTDTGSYIIPFAEDYGLLGVVYFASIALIFFASVIVSGSSDGQVLSVVAGIFGLIGLLVPVLAVQDYLKITAAGDLLAWSSDAIHFFVVVGVIGLTVYSESLKPMSPLLTDSTLLFLAFLVTTIGGRRFLKRLETEVRSYHSEESNEEAYQAAS